MSDKEHTKDFPISILCFSVLKNCLRPDISENEGGEKQV